MYTPFRSVSFIVDSCPLRKQRSGEAWRDEARRGRDLCSGRNSLDKEEANGGQTSESSPLATWLQPRGNRRSAARAPSTLLHSCVHAGFNEPTLFNPHPFQIIIEPCFAVDTSQAKPANQFHRPSRSLLQTFVPIVSRRIRDNLESQ